MLAKLLHKRLGANHLPGNPDFVFKRSKVAVFVQGCFWHRCPVHGIRLPKTHPAFWRRKFERNVERDKLNRTELESMGWKVIEVWEHEVVVNPYAVAKRIRSSA